MSLAKPHCLLVALLLGLACLAVGRAQEVADPNPQPIFEKLPDDFVVLGVGTYAGLIPVKEVQLDDSGHGVRRADVCVNHPEKPVVLVLTAYDPTVWAISSTEKTRIAGVLVSGYHGQGVVGIEKTVPLAISTYTEKGPFPKFYAYNAGPELRQMLKTVKQLVGRDLSKFVNKPKDAVFYVGDPPDNPKDVVFSDDLKIKNYVVPDRPPAGPDALEKFVESGQLRPAKREDIEAWGSTRRAKSSSISTPI